MRSKLIIVGALVCAVSSSARAFEDSDQFFVGAIPHGATLSASSEGVYFTGAPRFAGLDCSSCHTDGPKQLGLHLDVDDTSLFSVGYQPNQTYELVVRLRNETEGLEYPTATCSEPSPDSTSFTACNNNNFALEIDTAEGPMSGDATFCSAPPDATGACPDADEDTDEVVVAPDHDAVFGNRTHDPNDATIVTRNGAASWHLWWTAPAAGTGPLKLYVSAVDGNGGAGSPDDNQDPGGDDTVHGVFPIAEAGVLYDISASAGCAAVGARPDLASLALLAAWLAWRAKRRSRA